MKEMLPGGIRSWIGKTLDSLRAYARKSYSQEGEDLILERIFEGKSAGFYVDVGAHHPTRFSNTYRFYKRGWRGINIEPNPAAVELFRRQRKHDINVECGVAESEGELSYFMFNEPALNSFDQRLSEGREGNRYKIIKKKNVPVRRLQRILEESVPGRTHIDFMTIDVEGYDLQVLQSNDWSRFRPTYVLTEEVGFDLGNPTASSIHRYLLENEYTLFAKTVNTLFYLDRRTIGQTPCSQSA